MRVSVTYTKTVEKEIPDKYITKRKNRDINYDSPYCVTKEGYIKYIGENSDFFKNDPRKIVVAIRDFSNMDLAEL